MSLTCATWQPRLALAAACAGLFFGMQTALAAGTAGMTESAEPAIAKTPGAMNVSQSLEMWLQNYHLQSVDSPLNPNNVINRLVRQQQTLEARWQVQGKSDGLDFTLRTRGVMQHASFHYQRDEYESEVRDLYASQAWVRLKVNDRVSVNAGRMLLTWGQGNFRSPSNPYYFDAGRSQPLRELAGIDAMSVVYSGQTGTLQMAHIFGSGHVGGSQGENFSGSQTGNANYRDNQLLKYDLVFDQWQGSLIASRQVGGSNFLGANASWTMNDAWLLYGEVGNGRRPYSLDFSVPGVPVLLRGQSARATTALLGASYTMENGQVLNGEYLYDGHGFGRSDNARLFQVANQARSELNGANAGLAMASLGQLAQGAPVLLGRHYLAAAWQSNVQDSSLYWRVMWNVNLQDRSSQASAYWEKNINKNWSLFATASCNFGGTQTEFGSLYRSSLALGAKYFAF